MAKIALRVLLLVSIALNIAFLISHWPLGSRGASSPLATSLSDAQVERIRGLHQRNQPRFATMVQCHQEKQAHMINLLKQKAVDPAALQACLDDLSKVQREMQKLAVDEILECRLHLTHEQCQCLLDDRAEKMGLCVKNGIVCCKNAQKSIGGI